MRVLTCDPQIEISGEILLSILQSLRADDMAPYAEKHGLTDVQPGHWYPALPFLEFLNELESNGNCMLNFVAIGMSGAERGVMPPELDQLPFEELVMHWDDHYYANHRNGDIGHKIAEKVGDKHYQITITGIYPDDLEYGVLYGFAKRFLPPVTHFTVWYDENIPRLDLGGEKTVLHVSWE